MDTIILAFNVITPLMILLAIGYVLNTKHMISKPAIDDMNDLVFYLFLPLTLFNNIYNSDFTTDFDIRLIIFCMAATLAAALIISVLVLATVKEPAKRSAIVQASFRGNLVIFGLPLAVNLYGSEISGMMSIVLAFCVPLINILAVVCLEIFRNQNFSLASLFKSVLLNPTIIASFAAIVLVVIGIQLPEFISDTVSLIGKATTPVSLIVLGTSFRFRQQSENFLMIAFGILNKLVFLPLIVVVIAVLMGFSGAPLVIIMTLFSAPAAISCFPMAAKMGADQTLTSGIVVYTYVFCTVTIFAFIFVLKTMMLI